MLRDAGAPLEHEMMAVLKVNRIPRGGRDAKMAARFTVVLPGASRRVFKTRAPAPRGQGGNVAAI